MRRIEDLARPDQTVPPPFLPGHRMPLGDELIASQRVADQNGIALGCIQGAVSLVGDPIGAEIDAAVEPQRTLHAQNRVAALGERLALGIGQVVQHMTSLLAFTTERPTKKPPTGRAGLFRALRPFSGV